MPQPLILLLQDGRHFFVVQVLLPIHECQAEIDTVHALYIADKSVEVQTSSSTPLSSSHDAALLLVAQKARDGAAFSALWKGDTSAYGGDESAADMALCNKLAFWTGKDAARMDALFRQSGLMRSKWDELRGVNTYGKITIAEAIAKCTSVYRPHTTAETDFASVSNNNPAPVWVRAADVPYEPPRWLISPYFQRGKGTLIQADNGVGKTAFMCAVAAHVTTGRPLLGIPISTPGDVIILSVEDDLPVLRGRIEANNGDLNKCHFMTAAAGVTFNSPEIEEKVRLENAKLVIFDPFQAFIGANVRMSESNQTRPELARLFEMAVRTDCAVAIIAHMGKGSLASSAVNRSLGSVDIPAAMRSIFQLTRDPDDDTACIAVHIKCSNAPKGRSLSFSVGDLGGIRWNGFSDMTSDDLNVIVARKERGIPYENEPLIQVFQQLIADKPGGGFWPYEQIKVTGMQILGFPPFSSTADLKAKLDGPLARELQERDGLIVTSGHKQSGQRGIRIEPYTRPSAYQTSLPHEG